MQHVDWDFCEQLPAAFCYHRELTGWVYEMPASFR